MKRWFWLIAAVGFISVLPQTQGAGLIIVEDSSWWPGPVPPRPVPPRWPPPRERIWPPPHVFAPLDVNVVKVQTSIREQIAVTSVEQEFYNPNAARLEGTFIFPVPAGAHLDKFTMQIDGKQVQAELLSADKARGIYEDIVRRMKDPALLEYAGRDLFKVRIFPIEPHSTRKISLSYTQLLKSDSGLVSYLLPLSTEKFSAKPIKSVSVKVDLETKRPLKSIYSPSHSVEVKRDGANRATAGYESSDVRPDTDFALYFAPEKDEIGINLLAYRNPGEDGYFLVLASPGMEVKPKQIIPKDVVFVLDTSGSMAGKKLEQAKKALNFCIENLNDIDRFEIIRFSTEVEPLFEKLVEASEANRTRAREFVKGLKPIGATAIDDALRKALGAVRSQSATRPGVVIFLTDGRPTIGTTDEEQILTGVKKENDSRARVFCFGIGTDVNTHLLDKITEQTRAFSQYVLPEEDLEVKVSSFYSKIKEPVLTNPTLKFTGDIRVSRLYPSPLPDLFRGEQLVLAGRYSGKGDSAVVLEGNVNGETRKFTYEVKFPDENSGNEFIPRLWATRRVGYLLDEIRLHGENSELKDEATELAKKYGIVTPYTAYLIVEDEAHRDVAGGVRLMRGLAEDSQARREASQVWNSLQSSTSGDAAVADAQYSMSLKSANAPSAAAAGGAAAFSRRYGLAPAQGSPAGPRPQYAPGPAVSAPQSAPERLAEYSRQAQFIAGKTFFQNGNSWIDSAIQKMTDAKRQSIQFGSTEYFDLLKKNPQAAPWMALGQNVQFAIGDTVYEVHE